jgi:hypothetical protein
MFSTFQKALDGSSEASPIFRQFDKTPGADAGDGIVDAASSVDDLASRLESPIILKSMEDWVNHAFTDSNDVAGAPANGLDNFVAIHFLITEKAKHEQLWNAIHEVGIGVMGRHFPHYTLQFKVWQVPDTDMCSASVAQ